MKLEFKITDSETDKLLSTVYHRNDGTVDFIIERATDNTTGIGRVYSRITKHEARVLARALEGR